MAIKFSTRHYEFNHEKKPRGYGHWAFEFRGKDEKLTELNYPHDHFQSNDLVVMFTSKTMTLTEAKREIKSWLSAHGFHGLVNVAP